jgi:hypothetical protein
MARADRTQRTRRTQSDMRFGDADVRFFLKTFASFASFAFPHG